MKSNQIEDSLSIKWPLINSFQPFCFLRLMVNAKREKKKDSDYSKYCPREEAPLWIMLERF